MYKQRDLTSLLSFPPLRFPPCCCVHVPISDQVTGAEFCKAADRLVEWAEQMPTVELLNVINVIFCYQLLLVSFSIISFEFEVPTSCLTGRTCSQLFSGQFSQAGIVLKMQTDSEICTFITCILCVCVFSQDVCAVCSESSVARIMPAEWVPGLVTWNTEAATQGCFFFNCYLFLHFNKICVIWRHSAQGKKIILYILSEPGVFPSSCCFLEGLDFCEAPWVNVGCNRCFINNVKWKENRILLHFYQPYIIQNIQFSIDKKDN